MSANPTAAATESQHRSRQLPQRIPRRLFGLDLRRLRLFHPHLRSGAGRARFPPADLRHRLTLTASLVMRPVGAFFFGLMADRYGRRIPLMLRHPFLFRDGNCFRACAHVPHLSYPALALRHRHGRRLGRGRVAGAGIRFREIARHSFRNFAGRLRARQFARRRRLLDGFSALGLAPHVFHRRDSRAAHAFDPHAA